MYVTALIPLKSVAKFELSFSYILIAFYHIFIACTLLEIGRDKHGPVDCGSTTHYATFNFRLIKVLV